MLRKCKISARRKRFGKQRPCGFEKWRRAFSALKYGSSHGSTPRNLGRMVNPAAPTSRECHLRRHETLPKSKPLKQNFVGARHDSHLNREHPKGASVFSRGARTVREIDMPRILKWCRASNTGRAMARPHEILLQAMTRSTPYSWVRGIDSHLNRKREARHTFPGASRVPQTVRQHMRSNLSSHPILNIREGAGCK